LGSFEPVAAHTPRRPTKLPARPHIDYWQMRRNVITNRDTEVEQVGLPAGDSQIVRAGLLPALIVTFEATRDLRAQSTHNRFAEAARS
jgi:hypothetical protein